MKLKIVLQLRDRIKLYICEENPLIPLEIPLPNLIGLFISNDWFLSVRLLAALEDAHALQQAMQRGGGGGFEEQQVSVREAVTSRTLQGSAE